MVLILCAGALSSLPVPAELVVLHAADFGARPDDGKDDSLAVQAMLAAARTANAPVLIQFESGRYDFFAKTASKAHYPVTAVHLQWDLVTPFHLDRMKHLTIDGGGATFMMHGRMTPFVLNACEGVTVRNARIEHVRPSVFELKVSPRARDGSTTSLPPATSMSSRAIILSGWTRTTSPSGPTASCNTIHCWILAAAASTPSPMPR